MADGRAPKVFISSSAVGVYGDGGDRVLTEEADSGSDYLAMLCRDWEAEAIRARDFGVRVVRLRTGVVLGRGGGALEQMLTPFKMGVGGPIGSGNQYVPWIHIEDLVDMIAEALTNEAMSGAFNGTAPNPVTFRELATALGKQLHRPSFLPVPEFAVNLLFGDAAMILLQGQRAVPAHALKTGFTFHFETVESALKDILENDFVEIKSVDGDYPDSEYLRKSKPAFVLQTETVIDRPIEEVFPFFSRPENLGLITPTAMQFRITSLPDTMESGALIDYRLKVGPVPIKWRTRIENWIDGRQFVDSQLKGPYTCWWHEHSFTPDGDKTLMTDKVYYSPPAGPIGKAVNSIFIAGQLQEVFGYRSSVLRLRFGR
jgi:ligand-binding SRPBCC domain-containing protein